ncbi:MAG: hypothetical protein IT372_36865, partial [Polyangiaceae bacterium]|nr:hypothetical protein [Polyangiaceae bacterium]
LLPAGAIVTVAIATPSEGPVASSVWYELPAGEPPEGGVPGADAAVPHEVRGTRRRVGLLIPAEAGAFRRTARGWLSSVAQPIAIALAGIAAACPAVVALANLLAAR